MSLYRVSKLEKCNPIKNRVVQLVLISKFNFTPLIIRGPIVSELKLAQPVLAWIQVYD